MDIRGVDHVEFYVGDARQSAFLLGSAFGFRELGHGGPETGLAGQRSLLLAQGRARVLLTSPLVPNHRAAEYVARHGDGVACVAFGTGDTDAAFAEAVAAGARPIEEPHTFVDADGEESVRIAAVAGFGDVVHRFVERRGGDSFWPGAFDESAGVRAGGPELVTEIDHAAVLLPAGDLGPTVEYYQRVFGFEMIFEEYVEVGEQGMFSQVVQSPSGGVTFTLIEPDLTRSPGQINDFLAWHGGAGVQHVALSTHDIASAVETLAERGVGFGFTPGTYYDALPERLGPIDLPVDRLRPLGILVDRDHWGQMYQIFAKSMHVRRTYFWELIERHGARTFGTSNIPALYAAKERELAMVRDASDVARP